jgi:hypothetical protein
MQLGDYTVKIMVFNEGDMEHLQTRRYKTFRVMNTPYVFDGVRFQ